MDIDPWREEAQRGLMQALDHAGDSNAAQQVYRDFAQILSKDIRATPDKETKALYNRLRSEAKRRAVDPRSDLEPGTAPPARTDCPGASSPSPHGTDRAGG